ncbi:MAG TPA: hypothetical protein VHA37_06765 [Candidatus Saccharimonadales bacterium]|nr:hypothetical protein [Candidatus Saccharimonadales bacterium]
MLAIGGTMNRRIDATNVVVSVWLKNRNPTPPYQPLTAVNALGGFRIGSDPG